MKIMEILTADPEVISPNAGLVEAAQRMKELNIGALPVCDGERLVGMITDRDVTIRAVAEGRDLKKTKVRDVMTSDIVCCFGDQELSEAAALMENLQIRRLPILDEGKKLTGIVALGDIAVRGKNEKVAEEILECVSESEPTAAKRNAISRRAFSLYAEHGANPGHDLDDWLQAENAFQQTEKLAVHTA
jgi:CBS domain-containing protein